MVSELRHRQGRLLGRMEGLGFRLRDEARLSTLTEDVVKSSAIAKRAKCSEDTALRDIRSLLDRGILNQNAGGGRSTSYALAEAP